MQLFDIFVLGPELKGAWEGIWYIVLPLKATHVILEGDSVTNH